MPLYQYTLKDGFVKCTIKCGKCMETFLSDKTAEEHEQDCGKVFIIELPGKTDWRTLGLGKL
jgi:hypothetical protein